MPNGLEALGDLGESRGRRNPDQDLTRLRTVLRVLPHPAEPLRQPQQDACPVEAGDTAAAGRRKEFESEPWMGYRYCVSLDGPKPL